MSASQQDIERQNRERAIKEATEALRAAQDESARRTLMMTFAQDIQNSLFLSTEFSNLKPADSNHQKDSSPPLILSTPLHTKNKASNPSLVSSGTTNTSKKVDEPSKSATKLPISTPEEKPKIEFKGASFENLMALSQNLKSKYADAKSAQSDSEHIDYSFTHRDCEYSGKVQKNGSGNITIKNTGDWTHRDVEDLVNHIHQDVGSKSVRIAESTVYPLSMLLEACEEFEKRGIAVKVFSGNETKTIDDIRRQVDESIKDVKHKVTFKDHPNDLQETMKYAKIKEKEIHSQISPLWQKNKDLEANNIPIEQRQTLISQIRELQEQQMSQIKQTNEAIGQWLTENADHSISAHIHDRVETVQKELEENEAKTAAINAEYEEKAKAIEDQMIDLAKGQARDLNILSVHISMCSDQIKDLALADSKQEWFESLEEISSLFKSTSEKLEREPSNFIEIKRNFAVKLDEICQSEHFQDLHKQAKGQQITDELLNMSENFSSELKVYDTRHASKTSTPSKEEEKFKSMKERIQQAKNPDTLIQVDKKTSILIIQALSSIEDISQYSDNNASLINTIKEKAEAMHDCIDEQASKKIPISISSNDFKELVENIGKLFKIEPDNIEIKQILGLIEKIDFKQSLDDISYNTDQSLSM